MLISGFLDTVRKEAHKNMKGNKQWVFHFMFMIVT